MRAGNPPNDTKSKNNLSTMHSLVYNSLTMPTVMRAVLKCRYCGWEWIPRGEKRAQCPNRKCRKRGWDGDDGTVLRGDAGVNDEARAKAKVVAKSAVDSGAKSPTLAPPKAREVLVGNSRDHDPKTCRVYRCWQCIGLGKKF